MKYLRLLVLAAAQLVGPALGQSGGFVCDIPTAGCTNGMFNQEACACECIEPFCHDVNGDCLNPSNSCGGNPWAECTRGEDCPWWVNPLKAESCTTGPKIPVGLWDIYNTKTACCNTNFAYSTTCDAPPVSTQPTKHPTIAAPEDDVYEVIPIKFDVGGLPDGIKLRELKEEMTTVLKRILLRLADRISGLKISSIEEKVVLSRSLTRALRLLEEDVTLYFNVYVIRDPDKKFGPLIIEEIRDSYDEVLEQIQTFSDTKYFGGNLDMNWCTSENGKFTNCVTEIFVEPPPPPPSPPSPPRMPTPTATFVVNSDPPAPADDGLPGWAVALIIIIVLLFLCCVGYFIFVSCRGGDRYDDYDGEKEIENNIYMDDKSRGGGYWGEPVGEERSRGGGSAYGRSKAVSSVYGRSKAASSVYGKSRAASRSRRGRSRRQDDIQEDEIYEDDVQIVLAEPQDPKFDDDSFTVNTYGTSKKIGRDPTMYVPGQEDKPDPETSVLMITGGESTSRRQYMEDPPIKPKRDPTMYDDKSWREAKYTEDPPLKPKRDPTMYVDGTRSATEYYEGSSVEGYSVRSGRSNNMRGTTSEEYSADPYGMSGIDGSEVYDDFDFKHSELEAQYMTSETNAEYVPSNRRDPSYFTTDEDHMSFRTHDPSVADPSVSGNKSDRPKKSKKKKKKSNRSER